MGLFHFVYEDCEEISKGEDATGTYIISVKRTKNYIGNHLAEENQYWEYAQYDDHAGSFSTGYPCFGSEIYAETFDSVEKAREWFHKESQYLKDNSHDWTTLAIRKRVYETKEKLII